MQKTSSGMSVQSACLLFFSPIGRLFFFVFGFPLVATFINCRTVHRALARQRSVQVAAASIQIPEVRRPYPAAICSFSKLMTCWSVCSREYFG